MKKNKAALNYHSEGRPGKIEVIPSKSYATQRDLSLAYSPGVADPCMEIYENEENVYKYTAKGNLVAVISNGTAVLGLGDIGPSASKPVMEGKGLLFKIFADIDVFDIELDAKDPDKFIETVKAISPTFGGINLEDIKAPEAFEIEKRLKEELDIPVMHDDQHGTAIISTAALKNAIELVGKKIDEVQIVVNGAGAAAISCTSLYMAIGAKKENIVMCDSKGVIRTDRENLSKDKARFATTKDVDTLDDALDNADVFIGLSIGNILTPDMLKKMAKDPIVFAMANPDPEIDYNLAIATRDDVLMATGRSDFPNQVNNVLGFPYIFRGALDVRASKINEEMKIAATHALANLAKEPVPEVVNSAYDTRNLSFGKDYIIPKPFDPRLIVEVSEAVAKAAIESGVARKKIADWQKYRDTLSARLGNDQKLLRMLFNRAKSAPKKVVFTNGDVYEVLKAAHDCYEEGFAEPILLGRKSIIEKMIEENNLEFSPMIIDPKSDDCAKKRKEYSDKLWKKRQRKGMVEYEAVRRLRERDYFGAMMVETGEADVVITGYTKPYASALKPLLEVVGKSRHVEKVAGLMIVFTSNGPLFLADTSVNLNPSKDDLKSIAKMSILLAERFGIDPRVAFISYSNFGTLKSEINVKMQKAVDELKHENPKLKIDGEMQIDFALNNEMLKGQYPFSNLGGPANVLIFPNLESGNITYKVMKETNKFPVIGPVLMGMNKPAYVIQMKSTVDEIISITAIACIDAQMRNKGRKK